MWVNYGWSKWMTINDNFWSFYLTKIINKKRFTERPSKETQDSKNVCPTFLLPVPEFRRQFLIHTERSRFWASEEYNNSVRTTLELFMSKIVRALRNCVVCVHCRDYKIMAKNQKISLFMIMNYIIDEGFSNI